jgi:hypothetical protein
MLSDCTLWEVSSTDLLGDTTSFTSLHISSSEFIEDQSLASIDVPENTKDWASQLYSTYLLLLLALHHFLFAGLLFSLTFLEQFLSLLLRLRLLSHRKDIALLLFLILFSLFNFLSHIFASFTRYLGAYCGVEVIVNFLFDMNSFSRGSCRHDLFSGDLRSNLINISILPIINDIFLVLLDFRFSFLRRSNGFNIWFFAFLFTLAFFFLFLFLSFNFFLNLLLFLLLVPHSNRFRFRVLLLTLFIRFNDASSNEFLSAFLGFFNPDLFLLRNVLAGLFKVSNLIFLGLLLGLFFGTDSVLLFLPDALLFFLFLANRFLLFPLLPFELVLQALFFSKCLCNCSPCTCGTLLCLLALASRCSVIVSRLDLGSRLLFFLLGLLLGLELLLLRLGERLAFLICHIVIIGSLRGFILGYLLLILFSTHI